MCTRDDISYNGYDNSVSRQQPDNASPVV